MLFEDLKRLVNGTQLPLHEVVLSYEMLENGEDPQTLKNDLSKLLKIMLEISDKIYGKKFQTLTGLTGENGFLLSKVDDGLLGEFIHCAVVTAVSMSENNASMGKIVACPTAGACGVVPGIFYALRKIKKIDFETLLRGFIVAGGIGEIIAAKASISGAVSGCQAEIGTATAMAAAGLTYCMSEDVEMVESAASISLKSLMGLVCDPVGGFVEVPCVKRNGTAVGVAVVASQIALAGIESVIPFDEVVDAMKKVGKSLPESLKETALGGVASTPTARKILKDIIENLG
jgi:L-serine dehydratase